MANEKPADAARTTVESPGVVSFDEPQDDVIRGKVGVGEQVGDRAGIVGELFRFLWARKLWWLAPMVVVLLVFAVLMVLATATPLGPFIYTLI